MKRILKTVFSVVVSLLLLTHSFYANAIDFDAKQTFDSVFVVLSDNSLGSGFALGDQCVVTNAHVIQNTNNVEITSYDSKVYSASVYCKDDDLDIAVLVVASGDFTPLAIGNTGNIKIGDDVFAIGAPNGMSYTLTRGTLSSNKRIISGDTYLQLDAALNAGNSGGPLLYSSGAVIGMNTMKMNNSEGLGLAIPIDRIMHYMADNGISLSNSGVIEIPEIQEYTTSSYVSQSNNSVCEDNETMKEDSNRSILMALLCISVICNIIMILVTLQYRSKWKKLKTEQSERTDFEIDVWE